MILKVLFLSSHVAKKSIYVCAFVTLNIDLLSIYILIYPQTIYFCFKAFLSPQKYNSNIYHHQFKVLRNKT